MRIFIGACDICGQLSIWAQVFRALGHEVTTAVHEGFTYKFIPETQYDTYIRYQDSKQIEDIINNHDIFIFLVGASLLPNNADYPILHRKKKKIICLFGGSEIRYWPAFEATHAVNSQDYYSPEMSVVMSKTFLNTALERLRKAELYADVIFSAPCTMSLALRPYQHYYISLNTTAFTPKIYNRDIPIIVHAPSRLAFKGTSIICQALDELKSEGVPFELKLLHNVHNDTVLEELKNADGAIDQQVGLGLFSREAMASGCAVASGICEADIINTYTPYFKLRKENFKEGLREFLTNKELRLTLAHEGLQFVKEHYDAFKFCQKMLKDVMLEEHERVYDYYPRYFATEFTPPDTVAVLSDCIDMHDSIIKKWGLPHDAKPSELCKRGLLSYKTSTLPLQIWKKDVFNLAQFAQKKAHKGIPVDTHTQASYPAFLEQVMRLCQRYKDFLLCLKPPYTHDEAHFIKHVLNQASQQKPLTQNKILSLMSFLTAIHTLSRSTPQALKSLQDTFKDYTQRHVPLIYLTQEEDPQAQDCHTGPLYMIVDKERIRCDALLPNFLQFTTHKMKMATIFYILAKDGYRVRIQGENILDATMINSLITL